MWSWAKPGSYSCQWTKGCCTDAGHILYMQKFPCSIPGTSEYGLERLKLWKATVCNDRQNWTWHINNYGRGAVELRVLEYIQNIYVMCTCNLHVMRAAFLHFSFSDVPPSDILCDMPQRSSPKSKHIICPHHLIDLIQQHYSSIGFSEGEFCALMKMNHQATSFPLMKGVEETYTGEDTLQSYNTQELFKSKSRRITNNNHCICFISVS